MAGGTDVFDILLCAFIAVQALGAIPPLPPIRGPITWMLHWIINTLQSIARNADKLPLPPQMAAILSTSTQTLRTDPQGGSVQVNTEEKAVVPK
jgi:hypothetical protein